MNSESPIHPSGDPLTEHYSAPPAGKGVLLLGCGLFFTVTTGCVILIILGSLLQGVDSALGEVIPFTCASSVGLMLGLVLTLSGLYNLAGKRETYFNPDTGAMLHQGTLMGISWREKIGSPLQRISIDIPPIEPGAYPISISLLQKDRPGKRTDCYDYATTFIKACLIHFLTQDVLSLHQATTTHSSIWGQSKPETETFLRPGKNFRASLDGELENRIMTIMRDWWSLAGQDDRLLYPQGATIRGFASLFLERYLGGFQMVINTVNKDAVKRNLGTATLLAMRWKPNMAHASHLRQERERVFRLLETFATQYPDLDQAMHGQIGEALMAVESTDDGAIGDI